MLHLIKVFLGLCVSSVLCGCPAFAALSGAISLYGFQLYNADLAVVSEINVSETMSFATLTGKYDLQTADKDSDKSLPTDRLCITYGSYAGYKLDEDDYKPETDLTLHSLDEGVERVYLNSWGTLHAGEVLGGESATDYKGYFVDEILGLNSSNFIKQSDGLTEGGTLYEYYSSRDAALGKDYMLKLYYSEDKTGVAYLYGERDYTVSNAPLLDDFTFTEFVPGKSFAEDSDIIAYGNRSSDSGALFSVDTYNGAWDTGYVSIDGIEYNLHATNLRALESQGVKPFADEYVQQGYDTPTKGGTADVPFLFGRRVVTLKLTFKGEEDSVLRDASVSGFNIELSNNAVTDSEIVRSSYGIHPQGEVVDEQTFVEEYFKGDPYIATVDGETKYYSAEGVEISEEEYYAILNSSASENSASENSASDNSASSGTPFGELSAEDSESEDTEEIPMLETDWFVIGGLHTEVTLASLNIYLDEFATSHSTLGSGNEITYTVTQGGSKMQFVLEKSTTISRMEVWYENG